MKRRSGCMLGRDFIFDRLYNGKGGYFMTDKLQVGELLNPLEFNKMFGYEDYQRELYLRYPKNAWLTPSEIFKPYYGLTIANYINTIHEQSSTNINKSTNINIHK